MLRDIHPHKVKVVDGLIFFYTPLCGTCAYAEKMLNLALASFPKDVTAFSCNINFAPVLAKEWQIRSVPCLMFLEKGTVTESIYAFHSVSFLFDVLKKNM